MEAFGNRLKQLVINHYTIEDPKPSAQELEQDKWLFKRGCLHIPFDRWCLPPAAVLIQLCVGSLYAFSGYSASVETIIYGKANGLNANTFYIAVAIFGATAAVLGPWMERKGPCKGALLGAILFYIGNLLAAAAVHAKSMGLLYFGYGVVGGMGLGISYISPVSPLQKWFPDHRGLASGLAVCGFGGASIIAPYTQKYLIDAYGPARTFIYLGSIYFGIMITCAGVLRRPPPAYSVGGITVDTIRGCELQTVQVANVVAAPPVQEVKEVHHADPANQPERNVEVEVKETQKMSLIQSLLSTDFRLMYCMFFCAELTGLLILGKLQPMVLNQFKTHPGTATLDAATVNSINGAFNISGRFFFSLLSDKIGRKSCFFFTIGVQAILLGCLSTTIHTQTYWAFLLCIWGIAACYGGGFGMIPAFLADMFGAKNVGATHGIILTAWSMAGVFGALIFTNVLTSETNYYGATSPYLYDLNFKWILPLVCAGFVINIFISTDIRDRLLPRAAGERLRVRLFGSLYRLFTSPCGCQRSDEETLAQEWKNFVVSSKGADRYRVDKGEAPAQLDGSHVPEAVAPTVETFASAPKSDV